jgi:hypothetical protein
MAEGMRTQSRRECVLCGSTGSPVYLALTDSLEATPGTWGFQYWAALELLADPNSGEECILVATAPTD